MLSVVTEMRKRNRTESLKYVPLISELSQAKQLTG